ncbi:hypothetical protein X740_11790 [Mesorhizobium sp. LNHC221B00]|jgi:hypothetical protein|nr:hypothetical protein X740_11790 [Mesorhizobium sp. LNHC221B00]
MFVYLPIFYAQEAVGMGVALHCCGAINQLGSLRYEG